MKNGWQRDANDSSDGSVQEQSEVVGRHHRSSCRGNQGVLQLAFLEGGSQEFGHRGFGERVRSSPFVMKTVPFFLRGTFKTSKPVCKKLEGVNTSTMTPRKSGRWKLFFLLPRILLHSSKRWMLLEQVSHSRSTDSPG